MDIDEYDNDKKDQPKKKLTLNPRVPVDINLPVLGIVKLKPLTMGALKRISPALDEADFSDDSSFVKAILIELIAIEDHKNNELLALNNDQLMLIDKAVLNSFAEQLINSEGWVVEKNANGTIPEPISTVANFIRSQFKALGESTKSMIESMGNVLSDSTKKLFAQNFAYSEHLKELGGVSTAFNAVKNINKLSGFNLPLIQSAISPQMRAATESLAALNQPFGNLAEYSKIARDLSIPKSILTTSQNVRETTQFTPPVDLIANSPIKRSADSLAKLNGQMKEMSDVFKTMAATQGNLNQMVSAALLDFEKQRLSDTEDIKRTLDLSIGNFTVAKRSLIFAVILGGLSLLVSIYSAKLSFDSKELANESLISQLNDQKAADQQSKLQMDLMKASISAQNSTNELLNRQIKATESLKASDKSVSNKN